MQFLQMINLLFVRIISTVLVMALRWPLGVQVPILGEILALAKIVKRPERLASERLVSMVVML
jgi:hypothetical protein